MLHLYYTKPHHVARKVCKTALHYTTLVFFYIIDIMSSLCQKLYTTLVSLYIIDIMSSLCQKHYTTLEFLYIIDIMPSLCQKHTLCFWHKPTELAHSFIFCSCVYFCLYDPFSCILFINSHNKSLLSHSVLPMLFLPYWSFQLYIFFMKVSFSPDIMLCGWLGLKH